MNEEYARTDSRTRNWTFVLYPESAPNDWHDKLDELHIPWVESPLHEYDTNPDGEVKKAHIHVVLQFRNKKSYSQIKAITDSISQPRPEPVADIRGMCRYLIHRDNPEKYQYEFNDIICHQGFDISDYFNATKTERYQLIAEMIDYCSENHVIEFSDLLLYARYNRPDDWFRVLSDNSAMIMNLYIKSLRHKGECK